MKKSISWIQSQKQKIEVAFFLIFFKAYYKKLFRESNPVHWGRKRCVSS
ncbi:hypothetical protein A33Q_2399 [Indibacter alkaliphilus LW1]|uniref:Uncharacterized protein n=1 Tax=Indibacter alkaliphilus (strain CCUG 57479 / KCTC 22604 / LW1) TaxID=1189612 RepID=S2DCJ9_INDAL|nr:hypothetical protein A33Q_2399 [Indibacter alkaliphilus LW1]